MTNVEVISPHPADELLAAYADGKLDGRRAEEVFVHLDSCDDCRAIWDALADAKDEGVIEREDAPVVVRGNFGRKAAIGTLATAAAATAIFFSPPAQKELEFRRTGGVSAVIAAAEKSPKRNVTGRLTGFSYKMLETRYRSADGKADVELPMLEVAEDIEQSMPSTPSVKELRAQGLVQLLMRDKDAAIETLARAHEAAPNDPVVMNDLAAALIERGAKEDLVRALELSQNAWRIARTPEIAWNRALAYEYLGQYAQATAAWQEYLRLDPTSPWAAEVKKDHLDNRL